MTKTSINRIWTEEVLAIIGKIIDLQDNIISSATLAAIAVKEQRYNEAESLLPFIYKTGEYLELAAIELMRLKSGGVGASPKWYRLADNVHTFGGRVKQAVLKITDEIDDNCWLIIQKRLKGCAAACTALQLEIIKAIPQHSIKQTFATERPATDEYEILPDHTGATLNILDTLNMGKVTHSGRWRRTRS